MNMITTILTGLVAGVILATPPGIINLTIFYYMTRHEFRKALWVGAGSATLDIFYAALALYSTSAVYGALQDFIHRNPLLMAALELVFVAALLAFGLVKCLGAGAAAKSLQERLQKVGTTQKGLHPYFRGCLLASTHVLVPTFLPAYAYMAAMLIDSKLILIRNLHFWTFSFMFALGNLVWVVAIVGIFWRCRDLIDERHLRRIERGIGLLFVCVAVILLVRMIASTHWARMF